MNASKNKRELCNFVTSQRGSQCTPSPAHSDEAALGHGYFLLIIFLLHADEPPCVSGSSHKHGAAHQRNVE